MKKNLKPVFADKSNYEIYTPDEDMFPYKTLNI